MLEKDLSKVTLPGAGLVWPHQSRRAPLFPMPGGSHCINLLRCAVLPDAHHYKRVAAIALLQC